MLYVPSFRPKKCGMYFKFGAFPKGKFTPFVHKALLEKNRSRTVPGTRGLYSLQDAATQNPRLVLKGPEYQRVNRLNHVPNLVWDTVSQGGKGEFFVLRLVTAECVSHVWEVHMLTFFFSLDQSWCFAPTKRIVKTWHMRLQDFFLIGINTSVRKGPSTKRPRMKGTGCPWNVGDGRPR